MAGLGHKVWNAGDVLAAADVNGYLMDQSISVFADSTARDTALPTPDEGMFSYLKDTNATEYYDGAAWVGVSNPGDITSVVAGVGLSGGGTSGDVTLDVQTTLTNSASATYTVASADQGTYLRFTGASTVVTVATTTAFTVGQEVQVIDAGGGLTIVAGAGVTFQGNGVAGTALTATLGAQYEAVAILAVAADTYTIIGNVTLA